MVVDGSPLVYRCPYLSYSQPTPIDPSHSAQAFLSYIKIIDYSLLVGCDENRQELVVSTLSFAVSNSAAVVMLSDPTPPPSLAVV